MVFLNSLSCKGLYSYGDETKMEFSRQTVIVGPNNSGKSNLFRMIKLLIESLATHRYLKDWEITAGATDYFLEIEVQLSKEEVGILVDFLGFFSEGSNRSTQYYKFSNRDTLCKVLDVLRIKLTWEPNMQEAGDTPSFEIEFKKIGLRMYSQHFNGSVVIAREGKKNGYSIMEKPKLHEFLGSLSDVSEAKNQVDAIMNEANDKGFVVHDITPNIAQNMSPEGKQLIKNLLLFQDKELGMNNYVMFLPLLGTLLKKRTFSTTERRNFRNGTEFADHLRTGDEDFEKKLKSFANAHSLDYVAGLEPDGRNVAQFLFTLKNSQKLEDRKKFATIKSAFEAILGSNKLSFDVHLQYQKEGKGNFVGEDEIRRPTSSSIVIIDNELNKQYPLDQVGSGLGEILYLLALSYGTSSSLILLDEPSVNLHLPLMKSVMGFLEKTNYDNQFLIITHSPELVRHELFDGDASIIYIRKSEHVSKVSRLNKELEEWFREKKSNLRHQIDTRLFFGRCVVLVEGESEHNLLGLAGYLGSTDDSLDFERNDVVVTSVGGKNNFIKYRRYLDGFEIPYIILADADAGNLFDTYGSIRKDSIIENGPVFVIEDGNLEDLMRNIDLNLYREAEREFKGSKPAIASEFARLLARINPDCLETIRSFLRIVVSKSRS
ncbi:AAA family ATPase [Nitrososphaera sp.]|uniref:AAA family ATPase n=1 Tax=Nitrososphaera sp. TaxID=1971748 RepID=UPI00307D59E7